MLKAAATILALATFVHSSQAEDVRSRTQRLSSQCFACRMRVLTPSGYTELSKLGVGDLVMSWDEERHKLVLNRILRIHVSEDQVYGDLIPPEMTATIEVTADHPFFLPESGIYVPISDIDPTDKLRGITLENGKCGVLLTERGEFNPGGIGAVMSLDLEFSPDNFIVEGLVAQKKIPFAVPAGN
jgi:hypothetical protein